MSEFTGKLEGKRSADSKIRITADADNSAIEVGTHGSVLEGQFGAHIGLSAMEDALITLSHSTLLSPRLDRITLSATRGLFSVSHSKGTDLLFDSQLGRLTISKGDSKANVHAENWILRVINKDGNEAIGLNGDARNITVSNPQGNKASEMDGNKIRVFNPDKNEAIGLNGDAKNITIRRSPHRHFGDPIKVIELDGELPLIRIYNDNSKEAIALNGDARNIVIRNVNEDATLLLDGNRGDIQLLNADCAEEFDILPQEVVEPGTVMVINDNGLLEPSREPYDSRVAGIISGAGDRKPGIVLDKQQQSDENKKRLPIALMGKVYCKVDATNARIEVGDLLTTSSIPGHAMKATDHVKAFGAMIGKALKPLKEGTGMIPVLVALQ